MENEIFGDAEFFEDKKDDVINELSDGDPEKKAEIEQKFANYTEQEKENFMESGVMKDDPDIQNFKLYNIGKFSLRDIDPSNERPDVESEDQNKINIRKIKLYEGFDKKFLEL